MNFQVYFNKQIYHISQDFANYNDLLDQFSTNIPSLPDLFSVSFIGPDQSKMTINDQSDLEALYHLGKHQKTAALEIKDLTEDIFNMAIEAPKQNEKPLEMQFEEEKTSEEKEVFYDESFCSYCKAKLEAGVRFKCTVCADFFLCEKCEIYIQHQHDLIKNKPHKSSGVLFPSATLSFPTNSHQKSIQQATIQNATCIEQLFGISYQNAISFVQQNPGLSQDQLIQLAIEMKNNS